MIDQLLEINLNDIFELLRGCYFLMSRLFSLLIYYLLNISIIKLFITIGLVGFTWKQLEERTAQTLIEEIKNEKALKNRIIMILFLLLTGVLYLGVFYYLYCVF